MDRKVRVIVDRNHEKIVKVRFDLVGNASLKENR
jgi:hypothetical protein